MLPVALRDLDEGMPLDTVHTLGGISDGSLATAQLHAESQLPITKMKKMTQSAEISASSIATAHSPQTFVTRRAFFVYAHCNDP